jgi:hypothetical protein
LIKQCQKAADIGNFSFQCSGKLRDFMEKQADTQDKVDETSANWQELFRELEETATSKLNDLTDEQNQDLNKFDPQRPVSLPPNFRKHSVKIQRASKERKTGRL